MNIIELAHDPKCEHIKSKVCFFFFYFSFIDGTGNYDAYTFYNWSGIDIFCYFSHHLITIPPLGWINVGHAHGVKVIGRCVYFYLHFHI